MDKSTLLVVDDDEDLRTQMRWALAEDYEVLLAEDRESALDVVRTRTVPVVILDLGLPPWPASVEEGFASLADILSINPLIKVIIATGRGEKEHALRAVTDGAYDFLYKPLEIEELKVLLRRAFYLAALEQERQELQSRGGNEPFQGILGASPKMQTVFATIRKVATTDVPVLVSGESGTGKELVASAIHRLSRRKNHPFVVINCGAIPENLLEAELFGHEKGAYTGAHMQRRGRVEAAHRGTLFLDEIGELSFALQVKLLRFLQEQVIERIGGREQIKVDARVIAATNRDLKKAMKNGTFREDLYFRLGVITIPLPPLRERQGDVMLLANAFLQRYAAENKKKRLTGFTNQAIAAMQEYAWPGNVRELENRLKRAVIMAEGNKITPHDLEIEAPEGNSVTTTLKDAKEALERELVQRALARNSDNVTRTAEELGVSRPTLYELMEKLGIERK